MLCAAAHYATPNGRVDHCAQQWFFHGLWLLWPVLLLLLVVAWRARRRWNAWGWARWALLTMLVALGIDMRFIETQRIVERRTRLELGFAARIALISDIHLGLYKNETFAARVVERLNALDVDMVLIAGDWTYEPTRPIGDMLAPFKALRHKAYSVPGNHDEEFPGPRLQKELRDALIHVGIEPIEGTHRRLPGFTLVGLGDHLARKDDPAPVLTAPRDQPIVVLAHEPDTAIRLPPGTATILLAGHTHGGQVRLPFIGWVFNASKHPFETGMNATLAPVPTFVTAGLGETKLPIRLLNPPVIDILTIR